MERIILPPTNINKSTSFNGPRLAPLGQILKDLKLGEHIVVEYPTDNKPSFALAINHYRTHLKMGFRYAVQTPGVYEVRLETLSNEPIERTCALGQKLKALQFGQRIIVNYPHGKTPGFPVALACYRQGLDKGFLYEMVAPDTYEIWLGSRDEAAKAHRGLRHVQICLTETELAAMQLNQAVIRDWITVVLLAMRCGVEATTGRHLFWDSVLTEERQIEVKRQNTVFLVRRPITDDLFAHLESNRPKPNRATAPLCPVLSAMTNKEYQYDWVRLKKLLGLPKSRSLLALTWPWKDAHPGRRDSEIALNHMSALEQKWLSPAELMVATKIGMLMDHFN